MINNHPSSVFWVLLFATLFISSCHAQVDANSTKKGQSRIVTSSKTEALSELIGTYAEYSEFNGAVLVAEKGKILFQKGYGFANMEWDIPNACNTKFRIGSITKQFTAMLILQLTAENKLDLHVPISSYLPDYPKKNAEQITIHQLLTHSSGTPNGADSPKPKVDKPDMIIPDNYLPEDLVRVFSDLPLEFEPGKKFSYSNSGYSVLGLIIEKVTQKKFQEVLQDKIFKPLHMKDTGFEKHRTITKNRAAGYFKNWGQYYNANYVDISRAYAAGALYSTVEDLYRWDQAMYTEKLLPKSFMDLLFTPHIPDPGYEGHYGYGWSIKNKPVGNSSDQEQSIGHDGVIDGFCAILTRLPASEACIILLSNVRRAPLNAMTKGIMGILYDKPYDFPRKSVAYSLLDTIDKAGMKKAVAYYESIKDDEAFYLSENEMNIISYKLLQSDRGALAAAVLQLGIDAFPDAFNLYDSLGEVQRALGHKQEAIDNYKKSIELNPDNENGMKMLKEMAGL